MPMEISSVLVCDAVDASCVELLKSNGINVDYKLKLSKETLIEEAKVRFVKNVLDTLKFKLQPCITYTLHKY